MTRALWAEEEARLGATGVALVHGLFAELDAGLRALPDKPEETAASTLRALWQLAAGNRLSARAARAHPLPLLTAGELAVLRALMVKRLAGTPLAYLSGRQEFMGLEMLAGAGALIPRRETEILARAAVALARRLAAERGSVMVVDVCTGSGNVAAAVAVGEPRATVFASDLSDDAVALAGRNVAHLGVARRVSVRTGDLFAPFDTPEHLGRVDLVTCNPPYISTDKLAELPEEIAAHEPGLAFDGGPLGIAMLRRVVQEAPRLLRAGGWLAFEVGLGQGPSMTKWIGKAGPWRHVESVTDDAGNARVLMAQTRAD